MSPPLTLATATGTPVVTGIFEATQRDPLTHIHLARLADMVLVAPATYNFIGRLASGLADDPVTLLLAATNAPGLLAPAMHDTMWAKPILQRNLKILKNAGYQIIPPEEGLQATGEVGEGRMADIGKIISALSDLAQSISQNQEE